MYLELYLKTLVTASLYILRMLTFWGDSFGFIVYGKSKIHSNNTFDAEAEDGLSFASININFELKGLIYRLSDSCRSIVCNHSKSNIKY